MVVQFLKALFFKHAFGNDIAHLFLQTLLEDEYQILLTKFLNIGSDGPVVNKTIWNYLNEDKVRMGIPGLMQFIHCNINAAHNAFKKVCVHMDIKLKNLPMIYFIASGIFHVDEMILQRSRK